MKIAAAVGTRVDHRRYGREGGGCEKTPLAVRLSPGGSRRYHGCGGRMLPPSSSRVVVLGRLGVGRYAWGLNEAARNRVVPNVSRNGGVDGDASHVPGIGWKVFWSTVDTGAWLGAIGTAAAFVVTQEVMLVAGPLLLPLVALYASNERNRIQVKASQAQMHDQVVKILGQIVAISEEGAIDMADEVVEVLKSVEKRGVVGEDELKDVKESLLKVGTAVEGMQEGMQRAEEKNIKTIRRSTDAVGEGLKKLRMDIRSDLQEATSEEVNALARLDTRLSVRSWLLGCRLD